MEENTSIWSKTTEELTVGEQMKVIALVPVVTAAAIVVPLIVIGKIVSIRENRKLKKQADLTIVEEPTDEE